MGKRKEHRVALSRRFCVRRQAREREEKEGRRRSAGSDIAAALLEGVLNAEDTADDAFPYLLVSSSVIPCT